MNILVRALLAVALAGFVAVFSIHVSALAGSTVLFNRLGKVIVPGLFVIWVPMIFAMNRLAPDVKTKDIWRAALRGCPGWMRTGQWILLAYAYLAFFGLLLLGGGGMDSQPNQARGFSAILLTFYSIAAAVFYSATRVGPDSGRRCANGHRLGPFSKYCDECGAPASVESKTV